VSTFESAGTEGTVSTHPGSRRAYGADRLRHAICLALILAAQSAPASDYAAWREVNTDGSWTKMAEEAVQASSLAERVPTDVAILCPPYARLGQADRTRFWVGLLSVMARCESNFKPQTTYVEPDIRDAAGDNVVSRGLLQISQESANQRAYECGIVNAKDLHEPRVNLACAARIMKHWVTKDGVIAAQKKPAVGSARYWSVLRTWHKRWPEIPAFTTSLDACKGPVAPTLRSAAPTPARTCSPPRPRSDTTGREGDRRDAIPDAGG
jgi:hypothetical protein